MRNLKQNVSTLICTQAELDRHTDRQTQIYTQVDIQANPSIPIETSVLWGYDKRTWKDN